MKPLFDVSKYKEITQLKFECYICSKEFIPLRRNAIQSIKGFQDIKYCSNECKNKSFLKRIEVYCVNCNKTVSRKECDFKRNKSKNFFCNSSCAASYNNKNKKFGTRRSKLEVWIEKELKNEYKFEIIFNGKENINSELDIYIPSLKLAFELNGIFHYEPIYGGNKLKSVKNNDERKFQACLEKDIELCIIDTSSAKIFKPERDRKYLDIIRNIINKKVNF